MAIRVDRDVLYFRDNSPYYKKYFPGNGEATPSMTYFGNRGCPYMLFGRGSLTVEAAFAGTIFFLVLFSLLHLFQIVERYNGVQMQLASVACQYECYGIKKMLLQDEGKKEYVVGWDEQKGICYVRHREEIPYLGSSLFHVSWYQQIKISSYKGRTMVRQGQETGEYVYLADHGKVYHRDAGCVYLNPGIQEVAYGQVAERRNVSGGKYAPCRSCSRNVNTTDGSRVYITPYGDGWHTQKTCPGLKRSARKVLIEEVGGLPPCSKCG